MAVLVIAPIVIEEINSDYTPGALCGPPRRMGVVAGKYADGNIPLSMVDFMNCICHHMHLVCNYFQV